KTPESEAIAKTARAATEAIVATIEATRAVTLAGLKVKARAILWRRHGEPLEESCIGDQASPEEQIVNCALAETDLPPRFQFDVFDTSLCITPCIKNAEI
ncbi:MAG: hypothetical protein ACLP6E_15970, partial [Acidimicrobiales bacterium]